MPCRSSSAATRPTVWLHIGQTGTKSATSTPSAARSRAASGAVCLTSLPGAVISRVTTLAFGPEGADGTRGGTPRSLSSGSAALVAIAVLLAFLLIDLIRSA